MKNRKQLGLTFLLLLFGVTSFSQTFMVFEKMGTKKRFVYYIGEPIEYQLKGSKQFNKGVLTNFLDNAFIANNDTISFSSISKINIKPKRKVGLQNTAGPMLIAAGAVILSIDFLNRSLLQDGGYYWDTGIGTTSLALVATGGLIILLQKNKKPLDGWWRLRKAAIY